EVDEHDAAPVVVERVRSAGEIVEDERRRGRIRPRNEARRVRAGTRHEEPRRGAEEERGETAPRSARHALISRVEIVYLNVSGSGLSRRPCAVSDCGYMKKPSLLPCVAPGSATS